MAPAAADAAELHGPEARPLGERCLWLSARAPPADAAVLYNILPDRAERGQRRDPVEMVHDRARDPPWRKHLPSTVRKWMGDSVGRWTATRSSSKPRTFTDQESFRGTTVNARVTERFTRVAPDRIHYRFTVEDPSAFTRTSR